MKGDVEYMVGQVVFLFMMGVFRYLFVITLMDLIDRLLSNKIIL